MLKLNIDIFSFRNVELVIFLKLKKVLKNQKYVINSNRKIHEYMGDNLIFYKPRFAYLEVHYLVYLYLHLASNTIVVICVVFNIQNKLTILRIITNDLSFLCAVSNI